MPTDGGRARENDHGRFTDDVGEDLSESEIGERGDSLGGDERGGVSGKGGREAGNASLPLRKPTCWSVQRFDDQHGRRLRGG